MAIPILKLDWEDQEVSKDFYKAVESVRVVDESDLAADTLTLELSNSHLHPLPPEGRLLEVYLGYSDVLGQEVTSMGCFAIDQIKEKWPANRLTVTAKGFDTRNDLKTRKDRSFKNTNLGEIFSSIARENNKEPRISEEVFQMKSKAVYVQSQESDVNFIYRLCREASLTFKLNGDFLIIKPKADGKSVSGLKIPLSKISKQSVRGGSLTGLGRSRYGSVEGSYYDPNTALHKVFKSGSDSPVLKLPAVFPSLEEASSACLAALERSKFSEKRVSLELDGNPNLRAGGEVLLEEFRPEIDGVWQVQTATHSFGKMGYSTSLVLVPPPNK